jgi:hypothetical protein
VNRINIGMPGIFIVHIGVERRARGEGVEPLRGLSRLSLYLLSVLVLLEVINVESFDSIDSHGQVFSVHLFRSRGNEQSHFGLAALGRQPNHAG